MGHDEIFPLRDRKIAGQLLAERLHHLKGVNGIVLAIPRGGVPVAFEIAQELELPMDIVLSKKIGYPGNPEYAIGAVSMDAIIVDPEFQMEKEYLQEETARIREVLRERYDQFESRLNETDLTNKIIILVDDGIATGSTVAVSIQLLRKKHPGKIIVAVPVLPRERVAQFIELADELVYLGAPSYFSSVGEFYKNFAQVSDEEVRRFLKAARQIH